MDRAGPGQAAATTTTLMGTSKSNAIRGDYSALTSVDVTCLGTQRRYETNVKTRV